MHLWLTNSGLPSKQEYALKCVGYIVRTVHAAIAFFVLLVTILSNSIPWIIATILLELCILGLWQLLDNTCILTLIEERLTGESFTAGSDAERLTWINSKLCDIFGVRLYKIVIALHPYIVITILCIKILFIHTFAARPS